MDSTSQINPEKLQQLLNMSQWGWWKADFNTHQYTCSEYIVKFLELESDMLTFKDFMMLIREDFRIRITNEFTSINEQNIYEQTFPITTKYGDKWIHSKLGQKEYDEDGHLIAWGFLQTVPPPQENGDEQTLQKVNNLLYQQNSISRSLLSFLKTENTNEVINKILRDILILFEGSRVYIFEYDWEKYLQSCIYEVNGRDISPQQDNLQSFPMSDTIWWTRQLTAYSPILLSNLDELPSEAAYEKELLEKQGIKSIMTLPLIARDHVWGYIGIDIVNHYRNWNNEDYQWFSTLGNIISLCMELRKSVQKTQKEQLYFENVYQYMPIAYLRIKVLRDDQNNPVDFEYIDLNPAFETLTGKNIENFKGKRASQLSEESEINEQLEIMVSILQQQKSEQRNFNYPKRGKHFRAILYTPEKDEIVVLFSDITDLVKAHEALDHSEKTLRNIYQNIPVGIEIYDKHGYLRDMNEKDVEIFGLQDKSWGLGVNIFDNPNVPDEVKQQIRKQKNVNFQLKYDFSDVQGYYPTQAQGVKDLSVKLTTLYNSNNELENYLLLLIDNTETYTAQVKIREFENFFSVIADFAKVGYFKWNVKTRTGFALNQWFKNWGEPENSKLENVIGNYRMLHPDDREKIMTFYNNLEKGIIDNLRVEVRVKDNQGGWKWIRCAAIVTSTDEEHKNIELIGVNFDITELKEIEAKLIEAKNKAEALDKLKSAFLANMSHEIRTPLNAIVGFSNLLAETDDMDERKQYISIIQENNELLLQLISDILDLAKIEAGTFEFVYSNIDANNLCSEIVRSLELKTTNGVVLEFTDHLPECYFYGDRNRLMQVITNFITNALKFTPQGHIRLGYTVNNKNIEFHVSDTGIGIPEASVKSIFDRFVKLNSFIHGTGLGLSICKSIIEQMEGKIGVESEEGKGSRFWFTLPFEPNQDEQVKRKNPSSLNPENSERKNSKPRILIAEDTESNFILLSTILKKEYDIQWAHNGVEALKMFRESKPDLVLMDIRMPEMDGLTATRRIRETNQTTPIIALTAFAFDSDKTNALEAGCNDYMSKPLQSARLKESIRKLLE